MLRHADTGTYVLREFGHVFRVFACHRLVLGIQLHAAWVTGFLCVFGADFGLSTRRPWPSSAKAVRHKKKKSVKNVSAVVLVILCGISVKADGVLAWKTASQRHGCRK